MKNLFQQIKWQLIILHRSNLIYISVAVTVFYALAFLVLKDLGNMEKILTLLIFNDPAFIGLFFLGVAVILEKDQQVLSALFVSPASRHVYLLSRVLAMSFLGWACALGMALVVIGPTFHFIHFSAGVFTACFIFSLLGIVIVSYTQETLQFMLRSIPVLLVMCLPILNYFQLTNVSLFHLMPVQGCITLIAKSYQTLQGVNHPLWQGYLNVALWLPVFYWLGYKVFKLKIIDA